MALRYLFQTKASAIARSLASVSITTKQNGPMVWLTADSAHGIGQSTASIPFVGHANNTSVATVDGDGLGTFLGRRSEDRLSHPSTFAVLASDGDDLMTERGLVVKRVVTILEVFGEEELCKPLCFILVPTVPPFGNSCLPVMINLLKKVGKVRVICLEPFLQDFLALKLRNSETVHPAIIIE